jgi:hydrogenase nickel incorporation protein HypB
MQALASRDAEALGAVEVLRGVRLGVPAVVCVWGPPGCGKTSLLEATARSLGERVRCGVILANSDGSEDARRLAAAGAEVIGLEQCATCPMHLAELVEEARGFPLDVLLIESARPVGISGCFNVGMFSVSGGDDKPLKYPEVAQQADVVILNKIDLRPHVTFDLPMFLNEIKALNPAAPILQLSASHAAPLGPWMEWLAVHGIGSRSQSEERFGRIPGFYFG